MNDELIEQVARAIFACHFADTPDAQSMMAKSWGRPSPLSDMVHREALAAIAAMQPHIAAQREDAARRALEAAADMAKHQAVISGCQGRRTRNLGLKREPYFTEIADEAASAIRAIDPAQFREAGNG